MLAWAGLAEGVRNGPLLSFADLDLVFVFRNGPSEIRNTSFCGPVHGSCTVIHMVEVVHVFVESCCVPSR